MLTNHFWQGACRMIGGHRPLLLISKTAIKQKHRQPRLVPHLPTQCHKVFTWETLSGAFTKKRWKAFENMNDDYGNNSINESVCSIAKLFCNLLLFGDILTATRSLSSFMGFHFTYFSFINMWLVCKLNGKNQVMDHSSRSAWLEIDTCCFHFNLQ